MGYKKDMRIYTQRGKQRTHDHKRERKGKDKKRGRGAQPKAASEVTMGVTAFGPPPNLMRGGSLKEAPSL